MRFTCSIFSLLLPLLSIGQELEIIGSSGTQSNSSTYQVSYTIGELVVETGMTEDSIAVTQGFHQSNFTITNISEVPVPADMRVYPNPTPGEIVIESSQLDQIEAFSLYDMKGSLVLQFENQNTNRTQMNLGHLSNGTYFLKATQKENPTPITYQIIKSN